MLRFRTAALAALLVPLVLFSACSGGAPGGVLPTAQHAGGMPALTGGTPSQAIGRRPVSVSCPATVLPPSAARIGIHTPPTQRLSGAPVLEPNGTTTLPANPDCGIGSARPKRTMAWSGCGDGAGADYGCDNMRTNPIDDGAYVWSGGCWSVFGNGSSLLSSTDCGGYYIWESNCQQMGLPTGCSLGSGGGLVPVGAPCQPITACAQGFNIGQLWGYIKGAFDPPQLYAVIFKPEHFWGRLSGKIGSLTSLESAIAANIQEQLLANPSLPEGWSTTSQTISMPYDNNGSTITIEYRPFFYGGEIWVGTVYIP